MKRLVVLLAFLTLISSQVPAQTYGLDNADPALFTKFRIPDTDLHSFWFSTSFNFNSGKTSTLYPGGQSSDNENSSLNFSLAPKYYLLRESDNRYLAVNASASGLYSWSYNNSEGVGYPPNGYTKYRSDGLQLSGNEVYRNYLNNRETFYSIGSDVQFDYSDHYNDNRLSDSTRAVIYAGQKQQSYSFTLGIGWGKMRNVTPVVSAIRFQQRLKQLNLLNKDLSESTIEDLAQQFYREGYFSDVHVRPDKFFWQDVQNTLSRDGVSLAGLNQYADSYIREVPHELRFIRNEGIVGGLNLEVSYDNYYDSSPLNPNRIFEQLLTQGNAYLQYSHQLNLDSQLHFIVALTAGPNIMKDAPLKQQYDANVSGGYDYELTDRLVASVSESFDLTFQNSDQRRRYISNRSSVVFNYFVEDNVSFQGSYIWNYGSQRTEDLPGIDHITYLNSGSSVNLGMTYYIDRGIMLN